jgi:ATP-dependent helicase/nuclease subunit A
VHLPVGNAAPATAGVMVWAGKKSDDPPMVASARAAMIAETEDEYRRLLYVAMTRAADRLIVGGCMPGNRNEVRPLSWYDLIAKGLETSGLSMQPVPPPDGVTKRYCRLEDIAPDTGVAPALEAALTPELPTWLRVPAAAAPRTAGPLRPSEAGKLQRRGARSAEAEDLRRRSRARGTLVHRLLQSLPDLPDERRRAAALRFLDRNAKAWDEASRETLADGVLALIADPRFAAVFGPGSRAEVSIVGRLDQPGRPPALVSGQIDRLVVTPREVLIVDFKTNAEPPKSAAEAPAAYLRQLALYRAVLAKLYPQRTVRAALLWTESAEIMEISASALDAGLAPFRLP